MPRTEAYLQAQTALVTGANSGIGEAIARELAVRNTGSGGKAVARKADVAREDGARGMFAGAVKEFGTLDIVCGNAAGGRSPRRGGG